MKPSAIISSDLNSDLYFKGVLVLIFTLPVSSFVCTRLSVLMALWALINFSVDSARRLLWNSWDLGLYILVVLAGLIYTEDMRQGLQVIETSSSLLLLPLIFTRINNKNEKQINALYWAFVAGLLTSVSVCVTYAIAQFIRTGDRQVFFFENFVSALGFQPTYMAYYLIFGISSLLYITYYDTGIMRPRFMGVLALFMFVSLVLTGGRTAFISLLLALSFFVLKYMLEERTRGKRLVVVSVVIMIVGIFSINALDYWEPVKNDYWERDALWMSAIRANPSPLFGVGTGDYIAVLNAYLSTHGLSGFALENYNAHNQFIQTYFTHGLIGLFVLLIAIVRPLYLSVRNQNPLGVLVLFPFLIYGMTEVFLGRYQGIVFFVYLHQLVAVHTRAIKSSFQVRTAGQFT